MVNLSSTSQGQRKSENPEMDPHELLRMVEEELARGRAKWQRLSARKNTFRAASLLFLMAMIGAVFIAFFYYFSMDRTHDSRPSQINQSTPATPSKR
jgi:hypothetical protein